MFMVFLIFILPVLLVLMSITFLVVIVIIFLIVVRFLVELIWTVTSIICKLPCDDARLVWCKDDILLTYTIAISLDLRRHTGQLPGLGGETSPAAVDCCHHVIRVQFAPAGGEGGLGGGVVGGPGHEAVGFLLEWKWLAQSREQYRRG